MRPNLDTLRHEIEQHLESRGLAVFRSFPRAEAERSLTEAVYWDSENHPDYKEFVEAACAVGVRLVTLYARELTPDIVENAMAQLSDTDLEREERRTLDARLHEMQAYEGFTCQIELSFDHAQRTYVFEVRTDRFDELNHLVERIEYSYQDEGDENPLSGYYSNN
jgi:vacuolar-type H+-ATPase subunit I/STV1